jgi:hypothetical protein
MKKSLAFLALGLAASVSTALAATTLSLSVQEDALAPLTASSGTGSIVIAPGVTYGDFTFNVVSGTGNPVNSNGVLDLNTINVTTTTLAASHTLTIELTQTGLTGIVNPDTFLSQFSGTLFGVTSEKMTTYIDTTNAAFGTGTPLSTLTLTTTGGNSFTSASVATTSPFSETEIITAVFAPTNTGDHLNSGVDLSPSSAVPEPVSISLIGGGLALLGIFRLRRK